MRPYVEEGQPLRRNTSINKDLNLKGESAKSFLRNYSHTFHVNISDFDFEKYFSENSDNDELLTFDELNRAITLGSLDEMTINFVEDGSEFTPKYSTNKIITTVVLFIVCAILLCFVAFYV